MNKIKSIQLDLRRSIVIISIDEDSIDKKDTYIEDDGSFSDSIDGIEDSRKIT